MESAFQMDAGKLAFLGDAVYELMVRERIVSKYSDKLGVLNNIKMKTVCCTAQSDVLSKIESILTPEELVIYKRGRNLKSNRKPKNASVSTYRRATGLEALFGYLYLTKNVNRLYEFLKIMDV